jgi:hypothetical protein
LDDFLGHESQKRSGVEGSSFACERHSLCSQMAFWPRHANSPIHLQRRRNLRPVTTGGSFDLIFLFQIFKSSVELIKQFKKKLFFHYLFLFIYFFVVLEFELKVLCLLGRCSTA